MSAVTKTEPTVGDLLGSLVRETGTLVHREVRLASAEMSQMARTVALDLGVIGIGSAFALAGLLSLLAVVVMVLGQWIPLWLSALIVGVVTGVAGAVLIARGLKALRRVDPLPKESIEALKRVKAAIEE